MYGHWRDSELHSHLIRRRECLSHWRCRYGKTAIAEGVAQILGSGKVSRPTWDIDW
jgi:hypothetical protein